MPNDSHLEADVPDAALALSLAEQAGDGTLVFIDASGARLDRLAELARVFSTVEVLALPGWDVLPYDRAPPSAQIVGQRVATLARLAAEPGVPRLLLTTARALLQWVRPMAAWHDEAITVAAGDALDLDALRIGLAAFGYHLGEHVDSPGEVALRGHVIDLFPGDADRPVRIEIEDGRITGLQTFDPATQLSVDGQPAVTIRPVIEFPISDTAIEAAAAELADPDSADRDDVQDVEPPPPDRVCVLDYLPRSRIMLHPDAEDRWADLRTEIADAHAATLRADASGRVPPTPAQLFVDAPVLTASLAAHNRVAFEMPVAQPVAAARRLEELAGQIRDGVASGDKVVVLSPAPERLAAALRRRLEVPAGAWHDASGPTIVEGALDIGFTRPGLLVLAPPPIAGRASGASPLPVEEPPRVSDIMVHRDHGVCRITGLRSVGDEERIALEFLEGTELLVPADELDRLWRYGTEAGHIALDRLHGEAWHKRCHEIEAEVACTARQLAEQAAVRTAMTAPSIRPPRAAFARFVERFAFTPSPDQQVAIYAVLADLAAGRPMHRLVCGDVGFGKTEVALRATAAAVLAGYQVAIVAPTTVLARQHVGTFRKRFAGFGIRVEPMLRGAASAESRAVRAGLADGSIGVVVGTQAVAAAGVRFAKLGLVVIDEEQRFGDAHKKQLSALRSLEGGVHTLVMTATPIPRTLQAAMVGLRAISVIATAPSRRKPTRTFAIPFDPVVVREALLREKSRGGQSFVVCPRIEDLGTMAERLRELTPELSVATAHGKLKPEALETLVGGFAEGAHDVLLATNIIEAGLDIPRANTILVSRPDRFGLAQLHQMRGRVGRGTRRGTAYLLTEPDARLAPATLRRLRTLEAMEGLGGGIAISVADMDARGAGDLFGNKQAGHVHAIGTELYQDLLSREMAALRDEAPPPPRPELHLEVPGRIPDDMVPESNLRLELYRRLARLADADALHAFTDELADRFGSTPEPVARLLHAVQLRLWCQEHAVRRVDAGPQAVALTLGDAAAAAALATQFAARAKGTRVILPIAIADPVARLAALTEALRV